MAEFHRYLRCLDCRIRLDGRQCVAEPRERPRFFKKTAPASLIVGGELLQGGPLPCCGVVLGTAERSASISGERVGREGRVVKKDGLCLVA